MSTIQEREYVEKIQGRFHPTALGKTVNDLLIDGGFDDLFNESYTARMEEELDEIEEGKIRWTKALREFYDKFEGDLKQFQRYIKDIKEKNVPTEEVCLKCNTPGMVQKWGRFGPYLKCLNCEATRDAEPPAGSNGNSAH
jgi:DNA topoisomerase-1